jgi:uncharacterized protein (TIGR02145 family)
MKYNYVIIFTATFICGGMTGLKAQTVKDIDGNVYKTVKIGTQVWMAENLKTTKYNDGTAMPLKDDNEEWQKTWQILTPAYCWYGNNSIANKDTYGALYNWYSVSTLKLCPTGWHVPTDAEWTKLTKNLGGESIAGGKLKKTGTTLWKSPNVGATNESGFTALPSGYRNGDGAYHDIGSFGFWWSSSEYSKSTAWFWSVDFNSSKDSRSYGKKENGGSVRCVKDK